MRGIHRMESKRGWGGKGRVEGEQMERGRKGMERQLLYKQGQCIYLTLP